MLGPRHRTLQRHNQGNSSANIYLSSDLRNPKMVPLCHSRLNTWGFVSAVFLSKTVSIAYRQLLTFRQPSPHWQVSIEFLFTLHPKWHEELQPKEEQTHTGALRVKYIEFLM